jgi:hypothetical protein
MNLYDCPECGWVTAHYSNCEIANPSDQLTCHDINTVRYALEVYLAHQDWDKAHEGTIKRVLSKVTKLQDNSTCPA